MKRPSKKTAKTASKAKSQGAPSKPAGGAVKKPAKRSKEEPEAENSNKGGRPQSAALVLGVAESLAQAAELLHWPETILKQLKKAGAPGFRYSRVYFAELIPWIGQRGLEDPNIDWADRLKRAQALREEIRLAADQRKTIDRDESDDAVNRILGVICGEMDRVFCSEMPAAVKGQDELTIRARAEEHIEAWKAGLRERLRALTAKEKASDE